MKKHITQTAINNVVEAYKQTGEEETRATTRDQKEYFFGKRIGLIEAVALLTGTEWIVAESFLRTRARLTPRTHGTLLLTPAMRVA